MEETVNNDESKALSLLAPVGNIDGYVRVINKVPMLEEDDERALAIRLRDYGDLGAAESLFCLICVWL